MKEIGLVRGDAVGVEVDVSQGDHFGDKRIGGFQLGREVENDDGTRGKAAKVSQLIEDHVRFFVNEQGDVESLGAAHTGVGGPVRNDHAGARRCRWMRVQGARSKYQGSAAGG